jgi:serine/threonine protein kinase/ABC-type branched-subunit amino acid transport system substrate-binding protein
MTVVANNDPLGLVGALLDKKYRVDACIAEGGFGVVYVGRHLGLATQIAIKVLRAGSQDTDPDWGDHVARFLEEARMVASLRHPAVVRVIDAGVTSSEDHPKGLPWIVMEWLEGETLAEDLKRRRERKEHERTRNDTLALLRPVLEAVAAAHAAGIVHRDLNPNNVMLVPKLGASAQAVSARVLDFGIAKMMAPESSDQTSMIGATTTDAAVRAFTLGYAAPEQLSGGRTGPWTDVYALGLLITDVLCGGPSAPADKDHADIYYRAAFSEARPTPAARGVDAGTWEPILLRALAVNPQDRYPSAGELLQALDEGRARSTDGEPSVTTRRALRRWAMSPRLHLPAGTIGAAVMAAAALAMMTWGKLATRSDSAPPTPSSLPACTSNVACSAPGAPAVCRPGFGCVALRSVDCEPMADERALASDATVWFGTMFPRSGPDAAAFGERETHAVELARRDFAQTMSGTSVAGTQGRARPFGLIACDDAVDPRRAANHLVDVGVPAVIGFYSSVEAIDLTTSLFLPRKILAIASLNTNPLVTTVPHPAGVPRLVWRTTYSSAAAASAISSLVSSVLEPTIRSDGAGRRALRIALLRPRSAAGAALSDAFLRTLRFNGRPVIDNGSSYRELAFEAEAPRTSPEYARLLRELLAFAPDIVLYAGNAAIVDALFAPLEAAWPRSAGPRPRYVSIALIPPELLAFIGTNRERRRRFFGVTPVGSTTANARFVTHYNEVFPDKITRTIDPNASYDAFYLLAYATYTIPGTEPVTGDRLSRGFSKLVPPGRPIEVGLANIFAAYTALSQDESVDLTGATGNLDFDLATGEAAFDQAILCVGVDDRGGANDGIESGLVFSAASGRLGGTMRCP